MDLVSIGVGVNKFFGKDIDNLTTTLSFTANDLMNGAMTIWSSSDDKAEADRKLPRQVDSLKVEFLV